MERLPQDALKAIANYLWEDNLLHDKSDIVQDACALACVGNEGATDLARILFAELDPSFASWEPPEDLPPGPTVPVLKGLLKGWGLRATGNKTALLARAQAYVDEYGSKPRYCLVSAPVRVQLLALRDAEVSATQAKKVFNLSKYSLDGVPCSVKPPNYRQYKARDLKVKALSVFRSFAGLQRSKNSFSLLCASLDRERDVRLKALNEELYSRGAASVEKYGGGFEGTDYVILGKISGTPCTQKEAATAIIEERFLKSVTNLDASWRAAVQHHYSCRPKRSRNALRSTRRQVKANTLAQWLASYSSLDTALAHPSLPASLVPQARALWDRRHQVVAAAEAEEKRWAAEEAQPGLTLGQFLHALQAGHEGQDDDQGGQGGEHDDNGMLADYYSSDNSYDY